MTAGPQSPVTLSKPRVLSGIAATGRLHLGNYMGAIRPWTEQQGRCENFFFIADLHALTVPETVRATELRARIMEIAGLFLACGIDSEQSVIFLQSQVPAHAVLGWIFDCVTPVSWLERMTQYKSKAQTSSPSAGLLTYPALQAADILLYQANYVPVGDDQRQHVELTRDIAHRFNRLFGELFVVPETLVPSSGARIMGLDDPNVKMSKSLAAARDGHAIGLLDAPDKIRRTVMRAMTDSGSEVPASGASPGIANLLTLYQVLSGSTWQEVVERFAGQGYGVLKRQVADLAVEALAGIQRRYDELRRAPDYLAGVLASGAERANAVAEGTLDAAKRLVGLG